MITRLRRLITTSTSLFFLALLFSILAFPNPWLNGGIFAWVCWVPLFKFLNNCPRFYQRFLYAWLFFVLWVLALCWMDPLAYYERYEQPIMIVMLLVFFIGVPMLFAAVFGMISMLIQRPYHVMLPLSMILWGGFEWGLAHQPYAFPISLALSQSFLPLSLQMVSLLGSTGLSMLILGTNLLLVNAHRHYSYYAWVLLIGLTVLLFGQFQLSHLPRQIQSQQPLSLLQPNISWRQAYHSHEDNYLYQQILHRLSSYIQQIGPDPSAPVLLLPEYSIADFRADHPLLGDLLSDHPFPQLILGTRYQDHNSIVSFMNADIHSVYQKHYFVPGFEDLEPTATLPLSPIPLLPHGHRLGVFLCFELLFSDLWSDWVSAGADILATLSFNTWLGANNWPRLHMAYLPLRATQVSRSACFLNNNGPSIAVNGNGQLIGALPLSTQGHLSVELPIYTRPSLLIQYPWIRIITIVMFLFICYFIDVIEFYSNKKITNRSCL